MGPLIIIVHSTSKPSKCLHQSIMRENMNASDVDGTSHSLKLMLVEYLDEKKSRLYCALHNI